MNGRFCEQHQECYAVILAAKSSMFKYVIMPDIG